MFARVHTRSRAVGVLSALTVADGDDAREAIPLFPSSHLLARTREAIDITRDALPFAVRFAVYVAHTLSSSPAVLRLLDLLLLHQLSPRILRELQLTSHASKTRS